MTGSGMDGPHVAPAIASGFGLNEESEEAILSIWALSDGSQQRQCYILLESRL